ARERRATRSRGCRACAAGSRDRPRHRARPDARDAPRAARAGADSAPGEGARPARAPPPRGPPPPAWRSLRELRFLGRAFEREGRCVRRDRPRDEVEVAGADLALMPRRRVAVLLERELVLLQPDVRRDVLAGVAAGEVEHARVQLVEAGERDELEAVAPFAELILEARDRRVVEVLAPVERRRAVVGEQLAREPLVQR